jgi:hypothetical protein
MSTINHSSVAPGGNYTAGAGSSRKVIVASAIKAATVTGTPPVCSTITYNGVSRTPTVQVYENGTDKLMAVAIAEFLESEIAGGAVAVNHSWNVSLGSARLYCATAPSVSQGAAAASGTSESQSSGGAPSVTLSPVVVGGVMVAIGANRVAAAWNSLTAGWTEQFDETQGSAGMLFATADIDATSETVSTADPGEHAFAAIALSPITGVTITDAGDELYANGETGIVIDGTGFSGSGNTVKISPTNNVADGAAVTQTITAQGTTQITFTVVKGSLSLYTNLYLFVTNGSAQSNASGRVVQIQAQPTVTETLIGETGATVNSETGITMVIYAAPPTTGSPNPHQVITGCSTNGSGVLTQALARGSLTLNAPVWMVLMKDGSPAKASCRKVTPTYA